MNSSRRTLRRWITTVLVFAALYSVVAIALFAVSGSEPDDVSPVQAVVVAICAGLFWLAALLAGAGFYAGARAALIVGGIIAFPLGLVMITAGRRIKDAGLALDTTESAHYATV